MMMDSLRVTVALTQARTRTRSLSAGGRRSATRSIQGTALAEVIVTDTVTIAAFVTSAVGRRAVPRPLCTGTAVKVTIVPGHWVSSHIFSTPLTFRLAEGKAAVRHGLGREIPQ
jgi:hypothetical protein